MADLIDCNASIRFISNIERNDEDRLFSFEEIKKMLRDAPAVNRWIPVDDALPEKDKSYITYAKTTKYCNQNELSEEARINVLYFNGEELYDDECIYYNVTHYMPLPELPATEREINE